MAELLIKSIKCIRKDDPGLDKDETVVQVNSSTVSGPHKLGKGQSVKLNYKRNFTGSVVVSLIEQDKGQDDLLGNVTIRDSQAGTGDRTANFAFQQNADYTMTYRVNA
jgi:hypothetical protein